MKKLLLFCILFWGCASVATKNSPASVGQEGTVQNPDASEENTLMERLRQSVQSDPAATVAIADEGEKRFPQSPLREEREALAIRALIQQQLMGSARGRATFFLERYPNGPYSGEVSAMTGVHVTPKGPPH